MSERLSAADVAKVARMARLNISAADVERYTQQLDGMLDHFADIDNLQLADVQERLKSLGGNSEDQTIQQFSDFNRSEFERFGKLVKVANIKAE